MADAFDLAWDGVPVSTGLTGSSPANPTVINMSDGQPDAFDMAWDDSGLGIGSALLKGAKEAPMATYEAVKAIPSGLSNLLNAVVSPKQSLESGNTETVARGLGSLGAGTAGAGAGASAGASLGLFGGPFAPVTVPVGAVLGGALGGAAGLLGFDYLNQATGSDETTTGQQDAQKLAELTGGGVTMGAIGGAVKGGANMLASSPKLAEVLNRKSIGARQGDFAKSLKAKGFQETVEGDTTTNLAKSIEQVRKEGGFSGTRDPVALLDKNTAVLNTIEDNLSGVLKEADSVNTQNPIIPKYKISEEWIKTQPAAERGALTQALDEIKAAQNTILDGSLEALQAEKRALYGKTYGESGAAKEALAKYVASDLRAAIENGVDDLVKQGALPEKYSGVVKSLNERSGTYQEVRPILSRKVTQSMTDDPIAKLANIGFTTGGIGAPTIAGSILGGPIGTAIGAGIGLTGKALTTPTGQALTAAGLRGVGKVAKPISNLLDSVLTSKSIGAAQAAGEITQKESDALKLARKVLSKPDTDLTPRNEDMSKSKKDIELEIDADPFFSLAYELESGRGKYLKNPKSSASGPFQMINATAKAVGVDAKDDNFEDDLEGMKKLKAQYLEQGVDDDPISLYAAHYLGVPTLKKWLAGEALTDRQQQHVDDFQDILVPRAQKFLQKYSGQVKA
jgi:hypothetical protein